MNSPKNNVERLRVVVEVRKERRRRGELANLGADDVI